VWSGTDYQPASWWVSNPLSAGAADYWGRTVAYHPIYASDGGAVCGTTYCTGTSSTSQISIYNAENDGGGTCSNPLTDTVVRQTMAIAEIFANVAEGVPLNVGGDHVRQTTISGQDPYSFAWVSGSSHTTMASIQLWDNTLDAGVSNEVLDIALRVGAAGTTGGGSCGADASAPTFYGCVGTSVILDIANQSGTSYANGSLSNNEVNGYLSCRLCSNYPTHPSLCPTYDFTNGMGSCGECYLDSNANAGFISSCNPMDAGDPYSIECESQCAANTIPANTIPAVYTPMGVFDFVSSVAPDGGASDLDEIVNTSCLCQVCVYWDNRSGPFDTCNPDGRNAIPRPSYCACKDVGGHCVNDATCCTGICDTTDTNTCVCVADGDACTSNAQCCEGVCFSGTCTQF
jgi:hypothetical protein